MIPHLPAGTSPAKEGRGGAATSQASTTTLAASPTLPPPAVPSDGDLPPPPCMHCQLDPAVTRCLDGQCTATTPTMAEGEEPQEQEESRGRRALWSPPLLLCRECDHVLHKVGPSADHHARTDPLALRFYCHPCTECSLVLISGADVLQAPDKRSHLRVRLLPAPALPPLPTLPLPSPASGATSSPLPSPACEAWLSRLMAHLLTCLRDLLDDRKVRRRTNAQTGLHPPTFPSQSHDDALKPPTSQSPVSRMLKP